MLTRRQDCHAVHSLALLYSLPEYASAEVVAVDEARCELVSSPLLTERLTFIQAQFFSDLKDFCTRAVDVDHKTVLVAGLDGDFRREPFGQARDARSDTSNALTAAAFARFCT